MLLLTGSPALAGDWKRLSFADLAAPERRDSSLRALWAESIRASDRFMAAVARIDRYQKAGVDAPFPSISHVFDTTSGEIVVSMALSADACDAGPNSASSNQLWARCPMKVSITRDSTRRVVDATACYLDVEHDRSPGAPSPANNGAFAYLDRKTGELTVETIQAGRPVEGCTKVVQTRS